MTSFDCDKAKQIRLNSLKMLRDILLSNGASLTSGDVLLLSFLVLQVLCRLLVKSALLVSYLKRSLSKSFDKHAGGS
ncbi:hypothetical protein, partial [Escherichia coli]|uniref:hypothetical protein n=1 Tax=Escherichia coli TaxID=562 RepID=UPI003F7D65AC